MKTILFMIITLFSVNVFAWGDREQGALAGAAGGALLYKLYDDHKHEERRRDSRNDNYEYRPRYNEYEYSPNNGPRDRCNTQITYDGYGRIVSRVERCY